MNLKKIKTFCTLGPASLNKDFLLYSKKKISLLRLNMSHLLPDELPKIINKIRKYCNIPICIDTEGAQIRSKIIKKKFLKKNKIYKYFLNSSEPFFYPENVISDLKKEDILDVGFSGLVIKIINIKKKFFKFKVLREGFVENNKGIHLVNRKIKLPFLTKKDLEAIKLAKKYNIKNFALSFTNNVDDIKKFSNILNKENKIYKIETKEAINNLEEIIKLGEMFIIDRGDLSKEILVEKIPAAQRKIIRMGKKYKKQIYVATNFLESMVINNYPHRGEINDIYSTLEQGASGLVLAAETAIGKYPKECVALLEKVKIEYLLNEKKIK